MDLNRVYTKRINLDLCAISNYYPYKILINPSLDYKLGRIALHMENKFRKC